MISHFRSFCLKKVRILIVLSGRTLIFRFFTPYCFFPIQLKDASRCILNSSLLILPRILSLNSFLVPNTTGSRCKLFNFSISEDLRAYNPFSRLSRISLSFIVLIFLLIVFTCFVMYFRRFSNNVFCDSGIALFSIRMVLT